MPRTRIVRILHAAAWLLALSAPAWRPLEAAQSQSSVGSTRSDSQPLGATLARAGYVGVPFRNSWDGHQYIEAKVDTTPVSLMLDSGKSSDLMLAPSFGERPGVHVTKTRHTAATVYGYVDRKWAFVDRITLSSITLASVETDIGTHPGAPGVDGLLGVKALNDLGAIVDYDSGTLYLLDPHAGLTPAPRPLVAARTRNLYAALKASGRYRTFLALIQEAGLRPLLEGKHRGTGLPDSIAWTDVRLRAIQHDETDTMPAGRERILAVRKSLNQRLRRVGQLTVFAPTDAAFAQLPPDTFRTLRADKVRLAQLLRAHLVTDTYLDSSTLRLLVRGIAQPTGSAFAFHSMGTRLDIGRLTAGDNGTIIARATITQPDLVAANGVAHGIGRVLRRDSEATSWAAQLIASGYHAIPLQKLSAPGYWIVRAVINGTAVTLVLDTGAATELALDRQVAQRLNLAAEGDAEFVQATVSITLDSATTVPVSGITLADLSAANRKLAWTDTPPIDGIMGAELFAEYYSRLDFITGTLYLPVPAATPANSAPSSP